MTAPRIVPAAEAAALLEAATPGPWSRLPLTVDPIGPDLIVRIRMRDGDSDLVSAAPDLAASVVALHAEVERAATAERARIVAWLKERSDTAYAAGNEPRGDALLNASRVLETIKVAP